MKIYLTNNIYITESKKEELEELSKIKLNVWKTTYNNIYPNKKIDNYDNKYNEEKFLKLIENRNIYLYSIYDNNKLVGYFSFGELMREYLNYKQEIGLFYIVKEYQRIGIGSKIFNYCLNNIKDKGYSEFIICCNKYNISAQHFYLKMGGKIIRIDEDNKDKSLPQIVFLYKI